MLDDYTVTLAITARFGDTDMLGHVNNAMYLTYFESGRLDYWATLTKRHTCDNLPFILARTEVDFLAEARALDELVLGIRAGKLGNKSFELEYLLMRPADSTRVARGVSVQVMYDYATKQTQPISDQTRRAILDFESRGG